MKLLSISQSINRVLLPFFNFLSSVFLTSFSFSAPPPKFFRAKPKQAGKKEGGVGEGIFDRLLSRKAGLGWEAARQSADCCSKKVRASFSNCDHTGRFFFSIL
jgi:hypothetical protein